MPRKFTRKLDPEVKEALKKKGVVIVKRGFKTVNGVMTEVEAWVVTVERKLPLAELAPGDVIPSALKGIPTDVIEGKMPRALQARTDKWRPAPGGVSIGHKDITAGTLGCLVHKGNQALILSNNHIFANCNDGKVGDEILQPGKYDGGEVSKDTIALLYDFIKLEYTSSTCSLARGVAWCINKALQVFRANSRFGVYREAEANLVDCAVARPIKTSDVREDILEVGNISGEAEPRLGMKVKKSGRTTGLTENRIIGIEATALVNMGDGRIAEFTDLIETPYMSDGGDSGSALLTEDNEIVGLLFAGSDTNTLYCKFSNVKEALGLD